MPRFAPVAHAITEPEGATPGRASGVPGPGVVGTTDPDAAPAALAPQPAADLAEPAGVQGWESEGGALARGRGEAPVRRCAS
jgi:hypothetical protein